VSGNIRIADHAFAALTLSTTSGDAQAGTVSAQDFSMKTTSGDLTVENAASRRSEISTVSGDVRVKSLKGDATLHTNSGTVNVGFAAVPGRIEASSTSGDVLLRFPADAQFVLDARSTSGDITCRFPITISSGSTGGGRHALAGAVGTGTGQVSVRTVSGDVRIEK
jgi:lia operon protein LiaG